MSVHRRTRRVVPYDFTFETCRYVDYAPTSILGIDFLKDVPACHQAGNHTRRRGLFHVSFSDDSRECRAVTMKPAPGDLMHDPEFIQSGLTAVLVLKKRLGAVRLFAKS